jgi:hypothetical protein
MRREFRCYLALCLGGFAPLTALPLRMILQGLFSVNGLGCLAKIFYNNEIP